MKTQPPRTDRDGEVAVRAIEDDGIMVSVADHGERQAMTMSRFNAFRVFAMLSIFLDAPISKAAAKGIKL